MDTDQMRHNTPHKRPSEPHRGQNIVLPRAIYPQIGACTSITIVNYQGESAVYYPLVVGTKDKEYNCG